MRAHSANVRVLRNVSMFLGCTLIKAREGDDVFLFLHVQ